jgi:hypothetical protein
MRNGNSGSVLAIRDAVAAAQRDAAPQETAVGRNKIGVGVSSAIDVSGRLPPLDRVTHE